MPKALFARASVLLALVAFPAWADDTVVEVAIDQYRFAPAEVRIKVGDSVRWINREKRTSHSIVFVGENLPESERLMPGDTWARKFSRPGVYAYTCGPHPEMTGTVRVVE